MEQRNAPQRLLVQNALLTHEVDGELVLYDPDRDRVHTLNPTARLVWACCDGTRTAGEIVEEVARRCSASPERVRPGVEQTIQHLEALGALGPAAPEKSRRRFLSSALKGLALLPYVVPTVETLVLQDARAQTPSQSPPPPTSPPPTVSSCSPNNANPGDLVSVTVSGSDFQATPTADFGSGISVLSVSYQNKSRLSVQISVTGTASSGTRDVTITNPDGQSGTLASGFTVNTVSAPPPSVTACTPNNSNTNQTLDVTLSGSSFVATPTVSFNYNRIIVNSVTFVSSTSLVVNITVRKNAAAGSYSITVTNPDTLSGTLVNGFTVN